MDIFYKPKMPYDHRSQIYYYFNTKQEANNQTNIYIR